MFEKLDNFDWSKINHAYGPATDVPGLIRDLASNDAEKRERALWELHGNIWHQGTVYEATAYAVPFLLELVRKEVRDKLEILCLLAVIADGTSYLQVHRELLKKWSEEDEKRLEQEMQWVAAAQSAVAAGRTLFLELLNSSDRKIREICIYLLGCVARNITADISAVEVIERIVGQEI